jgi:hypothetical protein
LKAVTPVHLPAILASDTATADRLHVGTGRIAWCVGIGHYHYPAACNYKRNKKRFTTDSISIGYSRALRR